MAKLPDPAKCKHCGKRGKVINSRPRDGYWWRQRRCINGCRGRNSKPYQWSTFETIVDPTMSGPSSAQKTTY